MRKELAEVKMERDLLKKFATYFARVARSAGCRGEIRSDRYSAASVSGSGDVPGVGCFQKRLSVPLSSLDNWVRAARSGKLAEIGKGQRIPTELEVELSRMRKELAEVKMERDLLKKFATYCARESR